MLPLPDVWTCYKCGLTKPISEFSKNSTKPRGFDYCCKSCTNIRRSAHYEKNRAAYLERSAKWWQTHPDERRSRDQAYREKNRDKIRERDRKWRARNTALDRARKIANANATPWEFHQIRRCRRRAHDKNVPFNMKPSDLLLPETGQLPEFCPIFPHLRLDYCAGPDRRLWASVDRKVPELGYTSGNVWVVSMSANTWKSNGSNELERRRIVALTKRSGNSKKISDDQLNLF